MCDWKMNKEEEEKRVEEPREKEKKGFLRCNNEEDEEWKDENAK